jgi:hypothetical protein
MPEEAALIKKTYPVAQSIKSGRKVWTVNEDEKNVTEIFASSSATDPIP